VIEIRIRTSGKQLVFGNPVGAIADITNKSNVPAYFRGGDVLFILALETTTGGLCSCDSWFPNVTREDKSASDDAMKQVICLKPGDTTTAFANCSLRCVTGEWYQKYRFINFVPDTYPITVDAKYWGQENFTGYKYFMAAGSAAADYAAPRGIILAGAIAGGFLFTFLSLIRAEERALHGASARILDVAKTFGKGGTLFALGGSILLSLIITILLSRIEEAQSFIKVNISDFWGGIAVGFLANYGGWALLDTMVLRAGKDESKKQNQEPPIP
jgi:hypothetical protein